MKGHLLVPYLHPWAANNHLSQDIPYRSLVPSQLLPSNVYELYCHPATIEKRERHNRISSEYL